jgi:ferredoxin
MQIIDECIMCGACEPECPIGAISEGDIIYVIKLNTCVECADHFDSPQRVEIFHIDDCNVFA